VSEQGKDGDRCCSSFNILQDHATLVSPLDTKLHRIPMPEVLREKMQARPGRTFSGSELMGELVG
jgi:hypothetical protein